ncbi:hypothetical protein UFOVP245_127 [uncultured Caudovirales phage]|uniref:Uncharacterized protein n=1 Tax=uncultured Caudovirales phage TaxID=2100421 RepID=A0A6J7WUA8_9CAUD|nr:hypothetical protein UFOVP245_127 [uncultured Caudovirales phage]
MANLNPLEIKITDISIQKFNGSDKMSLLPQFIEISIYQSIFEPAIKAEMLVNDQIGLFTNYPFTGEELVVINYQQMAGIGISKSDMKEIRFIINGVRNIAADDRARAYAYVIDLISVEFLQNARKLVSHAYNDLIEDMAEKVYDEYIKKDTEEKYGKPKPFKKEESIKVRNIVVPNMRPFQSIQWLAKHAVAKDYENHFLYLFYEDIEGFNFVTVQKLIEDALKNREQLKQNKYRYVSDAEAGRKTSQSDDADLFLITNLVNNKRFSSIEKIAGGYYQNELFEISLLEKSYTSTPTELNADKLGEFTLEKWPLNTPEYIDYVKNKVDKTEYANRIRYIINNYEDFDDQNKSQPNYRYKIGNTTKYTYALNQIDLTITVPANMNIKAGDVIYCDIPENHGFNDVQTDMYITGLFIVSEVKQVLATGDRAATTMRINKDAYLNRLLEKSLYNAGANKRGDYTVDTNTGRVVGGV